MGLKRLAAPEVEPVTLAEAKDHLNFDSDDKDELIESYISAARGFVENFCHIVIAEALFEVTYDGFPASPVELPKAPLLSVESIKYDDENGDEQTLDDEAYSVDTSGPFGRVEVSGDGWPATDGTTNSVRIRFWAGYPQESGSSPSVVDAPHELKHAMLLMIGHFFANREAVGESSLAAMPLAVESLIGPYRVPVIA